MPTEVERAAAAVEAGHAWRHTANGRPGYATWPNIQPGDPSWWRRHGEEPPARPAPTRIEPDPDQPQPCRGCHACATDEGDLAAVLREHLPAIGEAVTELLAAPRRRWWHRLTRRAL